MTAETVKLRPPANSPTTGKVVKFTPDQWKIVAETAIVLRTDPDTDSDRPVAACLAELSGEFVK